jgi:hypothetical protein
MKADRKFGSGGGGSEEPEELRTILRQWSVPGPPPEIEEQLRRTFRDGRSQKRRLVWLAVAASLAVATSLAFLRAYPTKAPGRIAEQPIPMSPAAPPQAGEAPRAVGTRAPGDAFPATPKRVRVVRPVPNDVIVEPRQGELLLQLARQLNGTRQGAPSLSPPRIVVVPADELPSPVRKAQTRDSVLPHRDHWKQVESQWPSIHWSL